jgi:hypothetical protein
MRNRERLEKFRHGLTAETVIGAPSLQALMPRLPLNANSCCD